MPAPLPSLGEGRPAYAAASAGCCTAVGLQMFFWPASKLQRLWIENRSILDRVKDFRKIFFVSSRGFLAEPTIPPRCGSTGILDLVKPRSRFQPATFFFISPLEGARNIFHC